MLRLKSVLDQVSHPLTRTRLFTNSRQPSHAHNSTLTGTYLLLATKMERSESTMSRAAVKLLYSISELLYGGSCSLRMVFG